MNRNNANAITLRRRMNETERKKRIFVYCSILPVIAIFAFVRIIPIFKNFVYSLFESTVVNPMQEFVGLKNFIDLFRDPLFLLSLRNTSIFALFVTVFSVVLAVLLAALLVNQSKLSPLYETLYFLPVITPMVPVAVVWKWIYDPTYGLLNYILSWFGIQPIGWLVYPNTAMVAIIIMSVWKIVGYNMIIFLVGMRDIPETYIEAARIDGASTNQVFWKVIIPLLKPILLFVFVISTINSFNVFTQVFVMTSGAQGAPGNAVRTIVFDIYENGFRYFRTGYAAAEAVVLFAIILLLTFIQFGISGGSGDKKIKIGKGGAN
ncbi:MAG: sugar ABC transporter permease [Sphaerochaetaceae bacterium]|jgi:multiple sugar transport system permease protein|nr:sugar ABC transporter permease [Sphaerochaetaceae bacterium]